MSKAAVATRPPVVKGEQKTLPVEKLYESTSNPRVIVDDAAQKELEADVASRGVLTPLLVRKRKDGYEVLAGARRLKAAKKAGVKDVPVRIIEADNDADAHEIMVVENLQRKDIHALDEAIHFKMILDRSGGDVLALAKRVNKSRQYIERRLVLNQIHVHFRDWFRKGTIELDAAFALARLQPSDQEAYYKDLEHGDKKNHTVSLADVQDWTTTNVLRDIARVPWDVKDATLDPKAGPCTTCPKRTGVSKDMFADVAEGDSCTDGKCFGGKLATFMNTLRAKLGSQNVHYRLITRSQYESEGDGDARVLGTKDFLEAGDKKCETTTKGLVWKGAGQGTSIAVCTNLKCKIHKLGLGNHGERVSAAEAEKIKDQKKDRGNEAVIRDRVLTAVVNKVSMGLSADDMRTIVQAVYGRLWHEHKKRYLKRRNLLPTASRVKEEAPPDYDALFEKSVASIDGPAFAKILMELSLLDEVDPGPMDTSAPRLYDAAKRYKVDVKEIKDVLAQQAKDAKKPKAKAKK